MQLDAAHDAEPIYDLLTHQNIEPFIDLNVRGAKNLETESDIQISPKGIPICPVGKEVQHLVRTRNTGEPFTPTAKITLDCFRKFHGILKSGNSSTSDVPLLNVPTKRSTTN
ncbi:hypothetical protein [Tepidibacillus marianensis]|uniref:hypothetical protein n=1 Tax=Tepidibacillus marianensis TaxID=3131995 RepID=UPI0030CD3604